MVLISSSVTEERGLPPTTLTTPVLMAWST